MNLFNNPNQIPQSYGLKIAAGLIAYFLLMKVTGLVSFYMDEVGFKHDAGNYQ